MVGELHPGLEGEAQVEVQEGNTARHLGSGNVQVFATPEMIRLMEMACVAAVDHLLPKGYRTVGIGINVRHLAATPIGMRVTARAKLLQAEGKRLTFQVEAHDDVEKIGEGTHWRAIIEVEKFRERAERKRELIAQARED